MVDTDARRTGAAATMCAADGTQRRDLAFFFLVGLIRALSDWLRRYFPCRRNRATIEGMESPLNLPAELLRQADAIFAALIANPELLEQGRAYGLRFGIFRLCLRRAAGSLS